MKCNSKYYIFCRLSDDKGNCVSSHTDPNHCEYAVADDNCEQPKPKIIQIMVDESRLGGVLGLGDDGVVYKSRDGEWVEFIKGLE